VVVGGCSLKEPVPYTYVDPDPVYREPADYSVIEPAEQVQAAYGETPEVAEPSTQVEGSVTVDGGQEMTLLATSQALRDAKAAQAAGDPALMMTLLEQAATLGSLQAHYELARHLMSGDAGEKNPARAIEHLRLADEMGYGQATRVLAWLYLKGEVAPLDLVQGEALMEKAATTSVRAKREAGLLYANIYQPHLNNPEKGAAYLEEAYAAGDAEAAYFLFSLRSKSKQSGAAEALDFAAKAGHPKALFLKAQDELATGDRVTAGDLMKRAALTGDAEAMYQYATNVQIGNFPSLESDLEAYVWFSIAASRGHAHAKQELVAIAGVRTMLDHEQPGALDQAVADTSALITPWRKP
jgi:TPR repeat protein